MPILCRGSRLVHVVEQVYGVSAFAQVLRRQRVHVFRRRVETPTGVPGAWLLEDLNASRQFHAGAVQQPFPHVDRNVRVRCLPARRGDQYVYQAFPRPLDRIKSAFQRRLGIPQRARGEPDRVSPFFTRAVEHGTHVPNELVYDLYALIFVTDLKAEHLAHPVELNAIGIIPEGYFLYGIQHESADFRHGIIIAAVIIGHGSVVAHPPVFRVFVVKVRMQETGGLIVIVAVVHPDGQPWVYPRLAQFVDADRVKIQTQFPVNAVHTARHGVVRIVYGIPVLRFLIILVQIIAAHF